MGIARDCVLHHDAASRESAAVTTLLILRGLDRESPHAVSDDDELMSTLDLHAVPLPLTGFWKRLAKVRLCVQCSTNGEGDQIGPRRHSPICRTSQSGAV